MDAVSESTLFAWCGEDPATRFPLAASVVSAFTVSKEGNPASWAPITLRLVHSAPEPIAVMRVLAGRIRPMVWSGSRSAILDENANLLDKFDTQGNELLASFLARQKESLQQEARSELEWETKFYSDRDERFE